jgi:stage V sporulation protein SpoVS
MSANDRPLKVGRDTDPGLLAKSIAMTLQERENGRLKVRAMGPSAVNNMVKGIIIARQYLAANGLDLEERSSFESHKEDGEEVSVVIKTLVLFEI